MNVSILKLVTLIILTCASFSSMAKSEQLPSIGDSTSNNSHILPSHWDMNMIYRPTQALLQRESKGHINIYDGFKDSEVETIMDDQFDRIENMMFTRVRITDEKGEVLIDPETGAEVIAEDGCED